MSKMNNADFAPKRPKAKLLSKRPVSWLSQNRLIAAIIAGIFLLSRRFSNLVNTSDIAAKLFGKSVSDSASAIDSRSVSLGKGSEDSAISVDSVSTEFGKALLDSVYTTDDVGGEASVDDDQTVTFFKNLNEISLVTETITRVFTAFRSFSDGGSISDQMALSYSKPQTELLEVADSVAYLAGIGVYDTLPAIDSGYALAQDYVDNGLYFAEDYVGTKTIFT